MIPDWLSRTQLMLGDEKVETLMGKNVLIVGLGGVGGICAEMIVRAGVRFGSGIQCCIILLKSSFLLLHS